MNSRLPPSIAISMGTKAAIVVSVPFSIGAASSLAPDDRRLDRFHAGDLVGPRLITHLNRVVDQQPQGDDHRRQGHLLQLNVEQRDQGDRSQHDERDVRRHHRRGAKPDDQVDHEHDNQDRFDDIHDHALDPSIDAFRLIRDGSHAQVRRKLRFDILQFRHSGFGGSADVDDVGTGLHRHRDDDAGPGQ